MINISGNPIGPKRANKLMGDSLRPRAAAIPLILALTSTALAALTAQPPPPTPAQPTFTSGVTQVEVYATVTDAAGKAVKDLTREDFTILEDGAPQTITAFAGGDFPASVALAIDRSFSMRGTALTMARTAARAFVGGLRPDDRAMLISISGEVDVLAPLSSDKSALLKALESLDPWSTTSLHDALLKSFDLLEGETGRRAIVVLSDGEDRYSSATATAVVERARRSDVLMYPIAIGRVRPALFAELAAVTGGRSFHVRDPKALGPTLQAIAEDLRSQYLLGYAPSRTPAEERAEWRAITVKVNREGVRVRARSGYSTQ
jgi:Ca-activated chloride channel family protein